MLRVQFVLDASSTYHRYCLASIHHLLKFGHIDRKQIILRIPIFHMEKDAEGRKFLAQYRKMGIPMFDMGFLQFSHFNKIQPVEWNFGESPEVDLVLQIDPDTVLTCDINLNAVADRLCTIAGLNVAWYNGCNSAASQILQPERRKLRIRDLESCGNLADVRYDALMRYIFGVSHAEFLRWAEESKTMWVYGGCVFYHRRVLESPAWRPMCDFGYFTHCDEVLLKLGQCTGKLKGILELDNFPMFGTTPLVHHVCPHPLSFAPNNGWVHYASLAYRKQYERTLEFMLANTLRLIGFKA